MPVSTAPEIRTSEDPFSGTYKAYVLFILVVVYTFNFIDRQIVSVLASHIKEDLDLNDTQLGLLGGFAFALFYTFLGIPVARLADRASRTWIMTVALTLWSAFTALCGTAQSFAQLFAFRLGVGVGESGGTAPAYALISDYFPQNQRARALAIYAFGIPIGSAMGIVVGGLIADQLDWRAAFIIVGIAGVLIAPLFRLTVREPVRGQFDPVPADATPPSTMDVLRTIISKPTFWGMSVGAAFSSIMGYGLFFWMPSFFERSYGMGLTDRALYYGAILLVGGIIGVAMGGILGDRFGEKRKAAYVVIPAIALLTCIPFYLVGVVFLPPLVPGFFLFMVPAALALVWIGPVTAAIQHIVKPGMRATASAIFLFINNLIGLGAGPTLLGFISDTLTEAYGSEALRYAIMAGTGFYVISATIFFLCAARLHRDWEA